MRYIQAALFAPGSNPKVMAKALDSGADAVILDLEDSVSLANKEVARQQVAQAITEAARRGADRPAIIVRTNASDTGLLDDDVDAVVLDGLDMLMLPKAESVDEIRTLAARLDALQAQRGHAGVEIGLQLETALGVYRCFDLIKASPRVTLTCLGSARDGDLQTDLGCGWSPEGVELLYARSKVLLDSRAAGNVLPLDGVYSDLADEAGLMRDCRLSASLGYVGRTIIHPKQMAAVIDCYRPSARDIAYYRRVITEFEAAEKAGVAAITVDDKLIDYAMYKRAKRVLQEISE